MHDIAAITCGTRFDTHYEQGCVAAEAPDEFGNFRGVDSDGVTCMFHVSMIASIRKDTRRFT